MIVSCFLFVYLDILLHSDILYRKNGNLRNIFIVYCKDIVISKAGIKEMITSENPCIEVPREVKVLFEISPFRVFSYKEGHVRTLSIFLRIFFLLWDGHKFCHHNPGDW